MHSGEGIIFFFWFLYIQDFMISKKNLIGFSTSFIIFSKLFQYLEKCQESTLKYIISDNKQFMASYAIQEQVHGNHGQNKNQKMYISLIFDNRKSLIQSNEFRTTRKAALYTSETRHSQSNPEEQPAVAPSVLPEFLVYIFAFLCVYKTEFPSL